jgi:hypothetical protein
VAGGRDSVPPERLLKASLLMAFYRFGAKGCSRAVGYNLLFRLDHGTFSKNRAPRAAIYLPTPCLAA